MWIRRKKWLTFNNGFWTKPPEIIVNKVTWNTIKSCTQTNKYIESSNQWFWWPFCFLSKLESQNLIHHLKNHKFGMRIQKLCSKRFNLNVTMLPQTNTSNFIILGGNWRPFCVFNVLFCFFIFVFFKYNLKSWKITFIYSVYQQILKKMIFLYIIKSLDTNAL